MHLVRAEVEHCRAIQDAIWRSPHPKRIGAPRRAVVRQARLCKNNLLKTHIEARPPTEAGRDCAVSARMRLIAQMCVLYARRSLFDCGCRCAPSISMAVE